MIKLILARALNNVIGADGQMPWHLPEDLKRFRALTTNHIVIMGRKTWESLPGTVKPLQDRINVVITSDPTKVEDPKPHLFTRADTLFGDDGTLALLKAQYPDKDIWVIGGQQTYELFLPHADEIYETVVAISPEGDTFGIDPTADLTKFQKTVSPVATPGWAVSEKGLQYRFNVYARLPDHVVIGAKPWDGLRK